jgi:uncharacterized repeat protein (TIGR01451 family)
VGCVGSHWLLHEPLKPAPDVRYERSQRRKIVDDLELKMLKISRVTLFLSVFLFAQLLHAIPGQPGTLDEKRGTTSATGAGEVLLPAISLNRDRANLAPRAKAIGSAPVMQAGAVDVVPQGLARSDWHSIRAAYEAGRHAFQPVAGVEGLWQARNPGQQWLSTFDGRGFVTQPHGEDWRWGLELHSYGFGEEQYAVGGTPVVKAQGQRLSYQWDDTVQEWFINDQRGLEHGFIVAQRPQSAADAAPLSFTLVTRGTLFPSVAADHVHFQDAAGVTRLTYAGLKVWDADGKVLASRFEAAGPETLHLLVDERGARYPITIDPLAQQAYLKASNTGVADQFGAAVAVSGDTVVVGAPFEASNATGVNGNQADNSVGAAGAAYVFTRSGGGWTQQAYLKASNTDANDLFGSSVAVSGDTVVVGAPGEFSNATGVNGDEANNSVGSAGAAYVFTRSGGGWAQQAYLKASNTGAGDSFGTDVAVSGDTVVVGAPFEDSNATGVNGNQADNSAVDAGAAYVFTRSAGVWTQQAYLKASNTGVNDNFGTSVAASGDTVVVGAPFEDSNATGVNGNAADNSAAGAGAAYVFTRSAGVWVQQAYLKASNTGGGDNFGWTVAVSGDNLVVGAPSESSNTTGVNGNEADNSATNAGAAYLFTRSAGGWTQQAYLKASNTGAGDSFGYSVAVSGDIVVIGAYKEDSNATGVNGNAADNSAEDAGAAYVFTRSGGVWTQQAYLKASNTEAADLFGLSVAVSDDTVAVGAPSEGSNATGVNGNQADNSATFAGAVYVFALSSIPPQSADLAITQTDGVSTVAAGGSTTYTIVASNAGPDNVTDATVTDTFPASLTCTWTCSGAGGGSCTASGSGSINDSINLPAGGSVTYTAVCAISPTASGTLVNIASISSVTPDPTLSNNSATDSDTVAAPTYVVTGVVDVAAGGSINCASPVNFGNTTTCTVTTNAGYTLTNISGCGGVASATSPYSTGQITADCTVTAVFAEAAAMPVPTLSPSALALLAALALLSGAMQRRRHRG